jgi:hypothetical protein
MGPVEPKPSPSLDTDEKSGNKLPHFTKVFPLFSLLPKESKNNLKRSTEKLN